MTRREVADRFSVVIPARNAATTLGAQLTALAGQQADVDWEVVLADNGSTDATRAVAESFRRSLPGLRVIDAGDRAGASHARNRGAAAAAGDFLLFVDADDVVAPGWLAAMVAEARDGADLVSGPIDYQVLLPPDGHLHGEVARLDALPRLLDFLPWAFSGNLGVRREAFEQVGGFDTRFPRGEDVAFSWAAQLAGYELRFAPGAELHYRLRGDMRDMVRQQLGNGELVPQLLAVFGPSGARREPVRRAVKRWARLVLLLPGALVAQERRWRWLRLAALEVGRVRGMVRWRVFCP